MTHSLTASTHGPPKTMITRICTVLLVAAALFTVLAISNPKPASAAPGPFYYIVAVHSGKPIMPINHTQTWGAEIVQADWQNGGALHWKVQRSGTIGGQERIRRFENRHSKYCISSDGWNTPVTLTQRTCRVDYTWNEEWIVSSASDMWAGRPFTVWNNQSGLCMDVAGASTAAYTRVGQWPCHGGTNQQFRLVYVQGT